MSPEIYRQQDLWGNDHGPKACFNAERAITLIVRCDPGQISSYEATGFVEFEKFSQTPEGLIGYDLDADIHPNIRIFFAVDPWKDPSSEIYFIEGDYNKPLTIYRYLSKRRTPRNLRTVEDVFFHLMYPRKQRSRLQRLTSDEVLLLKSSPPFSSLLCLDYFY